MWYLNKTTCLYIFLLQKRKSNNCRLIDIEHNLIRLNRFLDIYPSKKVTRRKTSYLTIYNTLSLVLERILRRINDVNFVILTTYYSNWVHFQKLVQAKKADQYKISFPTIYNTLSFKAKKKKAKHADLSSHLTLKTYLPLSNFISSLHGPFVQSFILLSRFAW